jgi:aminoglycoside phosphotransferase family enzyme/predicted kinase
MIRSLLKSLQKPDSYPDTVTSVELIQTHVSYIFLTNHHAYKIKKPVDFGFLNFSTIDRRRFYCNEEVRLNRRLCPDIYEGVVELRESEHGPVFFGNGTIIDYAVKMRRLPAEFMLDRLIESDSISADVMRRVSRVIAEFHRVAPSSAAVAEYGRLERIMYNWQENFDQTIPFEETTLSADDRELIRIWVTAFASEHEQLFKNREEQGYIRECDGDIHLENICLDNGNVHIFDCIEFNDRFRYCDTAADIAFLLMDLDYHGRHDLSDDVIEEYVAVSGDAGSLALIDFYKIYRAFVRAKVESFRLHDVGILPVDQNVAKKRAIKYFRLVRGYIERRHLKQSLFITCGLMGCGKSTLATQFAFELGIPYFNSDIVRKNLASVLPGVQSDTPFNEGLYNQQAHESTYAELLRQAELQLATGKSVIIDACFTRVEQRARFAALAEQLNVSFIILFISCSEIENKRRLLDRASTGSSVSDGRVSLLAEQSAVFERPTESEGSLLIALHSETALTGQINEIYSRLIS